MTSSVGQRGKTAERAVHKYLERVDQMLLKFDTERLGDARSGGGRGAKKVVGDFSFFSPTVFGVLEVKEVAHDYRLPAKNVTQLPKLRKRILAGGRCYLLVLHTTTGKWRRIPAQELELKSTGSWDLRVYPEYASVEQALPISLIGGADG